MMWVVVYAKMVDDKDSGIKLVGVHFGGAAETKSDAESIARDCINVIKGGTIMPKLYETTVDHDIPRIMNDARIIFERKEREMITAAEIISRPHRKRK